MLLAVAECFRILGKSETPDEDQIVEFLLGLVGVAAIAAILRLLVEVPWEVILAAGATISAVLLAIAETFKILNSTGEIDKSAIGAFLIGVVGVAIIGAVLGLAAKASWDSLLGLGGAISVTLIAMVVCFKIMSTVNKDNIGSTIGAFLAGVAGVCLIGLVIAEAAKQPWQNLLAAGISISIVVLAMSVAMLLVSAAGTLAPAAKQGIELLDLFIADLTAVLLALGALTEIPGFSDLIKAGGGILSQIGKALGDFVGSIIEGIGEGVGKALEAIGKSLAKFMINATPFFIGLKMVDKDTLAAAKSLAGVVMALSVAGFIDGVTNLFSLFTGRKDMDTFGSKLVTFGHAVSQFDAATKGVDGAHVKVVAEATKTLIGIAKMIPNTGGLLAKITGDNDIAQFGLSLAAFAPSMAVFDFATRSISDTEHFKQVSESMGALFDVVKKIPNKGGLVAKVTGDNDIGTFGFSLAAFGTSLALFDFTTKNVSDSARMKDLSLGMGYLFDIAKKIPNKGGLASVFSGDNDIGAFGSALNTFGYWWKSFNIYTQSIDPERMKYLCIAIEKLIDTCKKIEEVDNGSLKNFGVTLSNMAKNGLKSFINVFTTDTPKAMIAITHSILQITMVLNRNTTMQISFKNLATRSINNYIKTITDYTPKVLLAIKTMLNSVEISIKSQDVIFRTLGTNNVTNYTKGLASLMKQILSIGTSIGITALTGLKSTAVQFKLTGETLAKNFTKAFQDTGKEDGRTASLVMLGSIYDVFRDSYDVFKRLGKNAAQGFIDGLDDKVSDAADEARKLAQEAKKSIEEELDIQSPSKVMRKDGNYTGEGFVLGMLDWVRNVKKAGSELGNSAIDGLDAAISTLSDDIDPTITPIVDLTNVMAAADEINAMFSEALANVDGSVSKASGSMNTRQQTNGYENIQNGDGESATNVTFNQYNTSPKALSRIDIYRQTRNQLRQFKEAVATR